MPRSPTEPTGPVAVDVLIAPTGLTDDQVHRLADVIAEQGVEVPEGLTAADRQRVLAAVRQRLRDRLVHLIARAVAWRLYRQPRSEAEETSDA